METQKKPKNKKISVLGKNQSDKLEEAVKMKKAKIIITSLNKEIEDWFDEDNINKKRPSKSMELFMKNMGEYKIKA